MSLSGIKQNKGPDPHVTVRNTHVTVRNKTEERPRPSCHCQEYNRRKAKALVSLLGIKQKKGLDPHVTVGNKTEERHRPLSGIKQKKSTDHCQE